jgi:hypothetical protein
MLLLVIYEENMRFKLLLLALNTSIVLPIRFHRLLYKKPCQKKLFLKDITKIGPESVEAFEVMKRMRDQGENVAECSLTFTITTERLDYGDLVFPLKPGGETIAITNSNLDDDIEPYSAHLRHFTYGQSVS